MSSFNEAEHPRDERGRFTGNGFFYTEEERLEAVKTFSMLNRVLETGKSASVYNAELGEIIVDVGNTGKSGYGIRHIIEQRYKKDGKNIDEITALLYLVMGALKDGKVRLQSLLQNSNGSMTKHYEIEKNGILAYVSSQRFGKEEHFLLTGFDSNKKQKEAQDAIQTVIARYSYTPEYSGIRKQAGAVIASLNILSDKNELLSSIKKAISKIEFKVIKWQLQERFG